MNQLNLDLKQFWPAIVAVFETVITGLVIFGVIDPSPDQLAFIMGIPAAFAGFLAPRTHASKVVLEELQEAD